MKILESSKFKYTSHCHDAQGELFVHNGIGCTDKNHILTWYQTQNLRFCRSKPVGKEEYENELKLVQNKAYLLKELNK